MDAWERLHAKLDGFLEGGDGLVKFALLLQISTLFVQRPSPGRERRFGSPARLVRQRAMYIVAEAIVKNRRARMDESSPLLRLSGGSKFSATVNYCFCTAALIWNLRNLDGDRHELH